MHDFSNYLSVFSWRYGTKEMRHIWSEEYKYELWRKIWVTLASIQHEAGLITKSELADLKKHEKNIDIGRILEIEKDTKHDVVAAIKEFAEKAKIGGGKIHLGSTSMDIVDNAQMLQIRESSQLVEEKLKKLLSVFSVKITQHASLACMGYTHLQPAEPTTVGYRLASYAQDLLTALKTLQFARETIQAKGMKGAVGTRASYQDILESTKMNAEQLDSKVMQVLGIKAADITAQVYPRLFDYTISTALTCIAAACAKFAADVRLMQQPSIGEWSEVFGKKQVGSSAMPFKKNPLNSEKICSLARMITPLPTVLLENAMHSYLERTLDDSANKRVVMPEIFLATDEILETTIKLIDGLIINEKRITFNLHQYAPFAATERLIIAAVKKGADRQEMHELMRTLSMQAWEKMQEGETNPLGRLLINNKKLLTFLPKTKIETLLDVTHHVGDAPKRAGTLARSIDKVIR